MNFSKISKGIFFRISVPKKSRLCKASNSIETQNSKFKMDSELVGASKRGDSQAVADLLASGAISSERVDEALVGAASEGHLGLVQILLARDAGVHAMGCARAAHGLGARAPRGRANFARARRGRERAKPLGAAHGAGEWPRRSGRVPVAPAVVVDFTVVKVFFSDCRNCHLWGSNPRTEDCRGS